MFLRRLHFTQNVSSSGWYSLLLKHAECFPTFGCVWLLLIRGKCYFLIRKQQLPPFILINLLVKTFWYLCLLLIFLCIQMKRVKAPEEIFPFHPPPHVRRECGLNKHYWLWISCLILWVIIAVCFLMTAGWGRGSNIPGGNYSPSVFMLTRSACTKWYNIQYKSLPVEPMYDQVCPVIFHMMNTTKSQK